ncbi:MAG: hypothetical protein ACRYFB_01875 [Janthinobacterium lividum]
MQYSSIYVEAKNSLTNFNQNYGMIAENAAALRILMNDDLYLSQEDLQQNHFAAIGVEPEPILPEKITTPEIQFLGENLQNFLILTDEPIQENHLKALENTLLRKQLTLDDAALVDFSAQKNISYEQLHASFMPQKLVLFGLNPEKLGLSETGLNQVMQVDELKVLYTYSFSEMLGNKEKTKAFWEPMKNL